MVYGPLTPVAGRLPLLNGSNNSRLLVVIEFTLAVLGAVGLDRLLQGTATRRRPATGLAASLVGAVALLMLMVATALVLALRGGVDRLLPSFGNSIGFWLAVAVVSVVAVLALALVATSGRPQVAGAAFLALALLEATMFAGLYNPQVFNRECCLPRAT